MTLIILRYNLPALQIPVEQVISIDANGVLLKIETKSEIILGYHIKVQI